ncbi:L-threonylcarbamoyladenylate synthase [Microbacterium sp.]|uniref:L-threonylcarbamoyladenylate synthase n=1 Tax=Microbacterium sp. TaxID=51671 RepID=UPI002810D9ED|nr:L-threonylcarbamoyladenylate synthase [Microbacterium sp.]
MSTVFDCRDEAQILAGMRHARQAIARGELVVLPTDTVYGLAADAFSPAAVQRLLDAKGRSREMPPPVLVAGQDMLAALVESIPEPVQRLVDAFWPGGLTIVLPAQPSLTWDLGETQGTVAVRMPDRRIALELIAETGPLAVSSANLTGYAAAVIASDAERMLGDSVAVYLEEGYSDTGVPSTIVDATSLVAVDGEERAAIRVLREGAVSREQLEEVLGDLLEPAENPDDAAAPAEADQADEAAGDGEDQDTADTEPGEPSGTASAARADGSA